MVTVEPITEDHLQHVLAWWPERDMGELNPVLLPPAGWVASDESGPVASAWLYEFQGCPIGQIDWLITKPGTPAAVSRAACRAIFQAIETHARATGLRMLFASACRAGMAAEAEACGFVTTARDVVHLAKAPSYV